MRAKRVQSRVGVPRGRWSPGRICTGVATALLFAGVMASLAGCQADSPAPREGESGSAAVPPVTAADPVDPQTLTGRWVRADYPYVLEITSTTEGDGIQVVYYNPQPINVSLAEAREVDGTIEILVELRDVNYPGSTYTLRYDATDDVLRGVYFQAVQRQNFDVTFVRHSE